MVHLYQGAQALQRKTYFPRETPPSLPGPRESVSSLDLAAFSFPSADTLTLNGDS